MVRTRLARHPPKGGKRLKRMGVALRSGTSSESREMPSKSGLLDVNLPDPRTSAIMKRVRRENTGAEETVARVLRETGLRCRRHARGLPGTPDFANRKQKFAIFVNGCFWHHHRGCARGAIPVSNRTFWVAKFRANRARDAAAIRLLRREGFSVMVVWECEIRRPDLMRLRILRFKATVERLRKERGG
jgi:DNA mismatch endonuclease (patch repair protein)